MQDKENNQTEAKRRYTNPFVLRRFNSVNAQSRRSGCAAACFLPFELRSFSEVCFMFSCAFEPFPEETILQAKLFIASLSGG
ncbi:MAG: hypothetical protein ISR85_05250 [Kiritimatiellales bacterium]|nr:hypothetical protein [Kiritimatiellota bacterium]MBL7012318.1 hypothetical protein [Kiritimatiellales bacterium]